MGIFNIANKHMKNEHMEKCYETSHDDEFYDCIKFFDGKQTLTSHEQFLNDILFDEKLQDRILNDIRCDDHSINLDSYFKISTWTRRGLPNKCNVFRIFCGKFTDMILYFDKKNNMKILNKNVVKYNEGNNNEKVIDNKYYKYCSNRYDSLNDICNCISDRLANEFK